MDGTGALLGRGHRLGTLLCHFSAATPPATSWRPAYHNASPLRTVMVPHHHHHQPCHGQTCVSTVHARRSKGCPKNLRTVPTAHALRLETPSAGMVCREEGGKWEPHINATASRYHNVLVPLQSEPKMHDRGHHSLYRYPCNLRRLQVRVTTI